MNEDLTCSIEHLNSSILYWIFRCIPVVSTPTYILAWLLINRNKSKAVQAVKKQYIRQMAINFISVIFLCCIFCPILMPPIPGYFMTGLFAAVKINIALPLVLMTHIVLIVSYFIMQLFNYQLITLSNIRYTNKFELPVKVIQHLFNMCYFFIYLVAITILPTLFLEFQLETFREASFKYFKNSICLCSEMLIADPRNWMFYVPFLLALSAGVICSITGVCTVFTCFAIVYDSRKMVSRDTLSMQISFTFILIYQASVCIIFVIMPLVTISTLFYIDISISENGLYFLILISLHGSMNNLIHVIPAIWRWCSKRSCSEYPSRESWRKSKKWNVTVQNVATHWSLGISQSMTA